MRASGTDRHASGKALARPVRQPNQRFKKTNRPRAMTHYQPKQLLMLVGPHTTLPIKLLDLLAIRISGLVRVRHADPGAEKFTPVARANGAGI